MGAARASAGGGRPRLEGATLYVTCEPCVMCVGAALLARIRRLVFGASNAKFGALSAGGLALADLRYNHALALEGGCMAAPAAELLQSFFKRKRSAQRGGLSAARDGATLIGEGLCSHGFLKGGGGEDGAKLA